MTDWTDWIEWNGGECPIPWAKAGEYGIRFRDGFDWPVCDVPATVWSLLLNQWKATDDQWGIRAYRYRRDRAPEGWRPPARERTVYADDKLDECVVYGSAHLERVDKKTWHLSMVREDGSELAVRFTGKMSVEERKAK